MDDATRCEDDQPTDLEKVSEKDNLQSQDTEKTDGEQKPKDVNLSSKNTAEAGNLLF